MSLSSSQNKEDIIAKWVVLLLPVIFLGYVLLSHGLIKKYFIGNTEIPPATFLILFIIYVCLLGTFLSRSRFFTPNGPAFFRFAIISLTLTTASGLLDGFLYVLFGACGPFAGPLADCGFGPGEGDIVLNGLGSAAFYAFNWGIIFCPAWLIMKFLRWINSFKNGLQQNQHMQ